MPILKSCEICKKEFRTKNFYLKKGQGRFCSRICKQLSSRKGKEVSCDTCGARVYKSLKLLNNSRSKKYFCGKKCQTIWRNNYYIGVRHGNWKGGVASYRENLLKQSTEPKCVLCGVHDLRALVAHHIDNDRKNNEVENLAWLCHNCHPLVHHYQEAAERLQAKI